MHWQTQPFRLSYTVKLAMPLKKNGYSPLTIKISDSKSHNLATTLVRGFS